MAGANIFFVENETLLCIVDYYRKFLIVKRADSLAADDQLKAAKIVFAEFGLPMKIISNADTNFTSEKFRQFCEEVNIAQVINIILSPPQEWSGRSMHEIHVMHNQKCLDTNNVNLALPQISSIPISIGLSSPATLLLKKPITGLLPQMNREPINSNNDDAPYEALKACQDTYIKNNILMKTHFSLPVESTVLQGEDGGLWNKRGLQH